MDTPPAAGQQLTRILSVVIFVPGAAPEEFGESQILVAGMQGGTPVAAVRTEEGAIVEYLGIPMKLTKAAPSGLVAPSRGSLIPPT